MNAAEQQAFDKMLWALERIAVASPSNSGLAYCKHIANEALSAAKAVQPQAKEPPNAV